MDLVLNRNFYNYVGCILFGGVWRTTSGEAEIGTSYSQGLGYSGAGYASTPRCPLIAIDGSSRVGIYFSISSSSPNGGWNHTLFKFNNNQQGDIVFQAGSDNTAATLDDTALVTPNTNITTVITSAKRDTTSSILYTVDFSASSEQVLSEIGLTRDVPVTSSGVATILFGRCALETPIELNEDNGYSVTLQIRLSLPIPA